MHHYGRPWNVKVSQLIRSGSRSKITISAVLQFCVYKPANLYPLIPLIHSVKSLIVHYQTLLNLSQIKSRRTCTSLSCFYYIPLPFSVHTTNIYKLWHILLHCVILFMLLFPIQQRKGGVRLIEAIVSFLSAVAAGVACHYIIKWLDSGDNNN